jgi:tetratricopeptide (TPR) repeat protein
VLRIKRIIQYLNGEYKNFGRVRMQDTRYLVVLYGATKIDEFNQKGTKNGRFLYFSYNQLKYFSKFSVRGQELLFDATKTARKVYPSLKEKGWVSIEKIHFESGGYGDGVAITRKGLNSARKKLNEIENVLSNKIPEEEQQEQQEDKWREEEYREDLQNHVTDPNFIYQPPLTKEEVKQFIKLNLSLTDEELIDKTTDEIYDESKGDPGMVEFYVTDKRVEHDVEEISDRYLSSPLERKTVLICSILEISDTQITDELLENCEVLETAYNLDGSVLRRTSNRLWKTKGRRWALKLFSFLFNKTSATQLEERKQDLNDSLIALYQIKEEKITYSAINALYYVVDKNFVPKAVVESVFQKSKSQIKPFMSFLFVSFQGGIAGAYCSLKDHKEGQERLDREAAQGKYEKAKCCYDLEDNEGAMKYCDEALEINPSLTAASDLKKEAMARICANMSNDDCID